MGSQILAVFLVLIVLAGIVLLAVNEPSGSGEPDLYQMQANARATATVAAAQEAGANAMVDAASQATAEALQATAEAQRAAQAAAEATRQAQAEATTAAVAAVESTRQAHIEEIALQATIEAGRAQATDVARERQAQATEAARSTASAAQAHAAATVESATATAEYVAPTRTVVAADTESYIAARDWERRAAPWKEIGKAAFWTALGVLVILACAWVFPRAWIALQMRFLRVTEAGDGPEWMIVGAQGLIKAWSGAFQATPYNSDRDRGPGQTIDPHQSPGLLPGADPRVTERDQIVQGLTRPVQAAASAPQAAQQAAMRRASRATDTRNPLAAIPGVSNGGRRAYRVIPPGAALPLPVRRALDDAVVAHLDNDWRSDDA